MGRQKNDGRGRMGGRKKGTPNKASSNLKEWVQTLLNNNRARFEKDLEEVEPEKRLTFLLKLFDYVLPKQTQTKLELDKLTDEQINQVIESIEV